MKIILILLLMALFTGSPTEAQDAQAKQLKPQTANKTATRPANKRETPHLEFVTEYIRELAAIQDIRDAAESEIRSKIRRRCFRTCGHSSTLMQLELGSQIGQLKGMRLDDPFSDLIPNIITFYQDKIELWQQMTDICSAFVGGPNPNVDYAKLAADMPKTRAKLDFIDKALFEATPAIFMTLIDSKPDSNGHASHLTITKADARISSSRLTQTSDQSSRRRALLHGQRGMGFEKGLQKDFKCSDEPWD